MVVAQSIPNGTTNFEDDVINIEFNEFIKLESKGIVISPPIPKDAIKIMAIRNSLKVKFLSSLIDSTTYILNFASSISDVNEGNKLNDFKIIFSTGDKIDSLELSGSVNIKHPDISFEKNSYALLHMNQDDSIVAKEKPHYLSQIDESGQFSMNYIRRGKYKLYVLKDQNANYLYDLPNEGIGFYGDVIDLDSTVNGLDIDLFLPEQPDKIVEYSNVERGKFRLKFNNTLPSSYDIKLSSTVTDSVVYLKSDDRLSLDCWLIPEPDSLLDELKVYLDIGATVKDTLDLYNVISSRKNELSPQLAADALLEGDTVQLHMGHPYWTESDLVFSIKDTADQESGRIINVERQSPLTLNLILDSLNFSKQHNLWIIHENDSTQIELLFKSTEEVGRLILDFDILNDSSNAYIVELMNDKKQIIDTRIFNDRKFRMSVVNLDPGTYTVKVISDRNKNGRWDSGIFWDRTGPELYFEYIKDLTVKANWDVEESISVSF